MRFIIIPKKDGSYNHVEIPSTTPELDTTGKPVTYTQTNADGTTSTIPLTVNLPPPKIVGNAYSVDVTDATGIPAAVAAYVAAHAPAPATRPAV